MEPSRGRALVNRLASEGLASEGLDLCLDEPMSRHTTLRLGGPADIWARPADIDTLADLLVRCDRAEIPITVVGAGTNLLVRDGGIRGVVINLGRLRRVDCVEPAAADPASPRTIVVEAGASTGRLLTHALGWELGGLEFLAGVPGTVGGGLIMNAGTLLGEFTDVVAQVESITTDGSRRRRDHQACGFRYRGSDLPPNELVIGATLTLSPRPRAEIDALIAGLRERRRRREPRIPRNCGSTFKNPVDDHAGRLIEAAGLKGERRGAALVSPDHANWLVMDPTSDQPSTAQDYAALMDYVRVRVQSVHGVDLLPEVRILGEA